MGTEAERVGEAVKTVVEESNSAATQAVKNAEERVNAATRTAEEIAAAAIHTDLGSRVSKHEEELNTWRADREALTNRLQTLETQNQQMAGVLSSQSLILEKLTQPPPPPPTEATILAVEGEKSGSTKTEASPKSEGEKPDTEKKEAAKKRRLWM